MSWASILLLVGADDGYNGSCARVAGSRPVAWGWFICSVGKSSRRTRREHLCSRRCFLLEVNLFLSLLHGYCELDGAELKIDLERVGIARIQIAGDEIKLPVVTNIVE